MPLEFRMAESPSLLGDTQPELTPQMAEPVVPAANGSEAPTLPAELPAEGMEAADADVLDDSILELDAICKKCLQPVVPSDAVVKAPKVLWCRECNSIYSMLRRHQQWPPACFNGLSTENQAEFWSRCKKEKDNGSFNYKRVRDVLVRTTTESKCKEKRLDVGGTYLPLSVYQQRGYKVDDGFCSRNAKQWSDGLQEWTYLLCETSVNDAEITKNVESEVAEAERQVKKRKMKDEDNDKKKDAKEEKPKDQNASSSAAAPTSLVLDLVTDSEGRK